MSATHSEELTLTLQSIIDTAIDGIITIDQTGCILTINQAAQKLFGYAESELIGHKINMLMPNPYSQEHDQYIHRYLQTKNPKIIGIGREVLGLKKTGDTFPFHLAVSEVVLNDRIIFTGIIHDLSDVKAIQNKLQQNNESLEAQVEQRTKELEVVVNKLLAANRKLEKRETALVESLEKEKELNELKSRFVSMASHEFRTPLSTIMSSASLINKYKREDQQENRAKHTERIRSAVNNLTGILNDFLSLGKLEENKVALQKEAVDLDTLCKEIFSELQSIIKPAQMLQHDHTAGDHIVVTDKRVLKNILFNLISNAIKYSKDGTTIFCRSKSSDDGFEIEIEDQGIGIPKQEQHYLFDRFFRATNVETVQGTGLGLHIVKRYVDLMNGSIDFESEEHKGSTFKINFKK